MPNDVWSGVGGTVVGLILGALISYIPRFIGQRDKVKAYKESLLAEIKKCAEMAELYYEENIPQQSCRLPTFSLENSYPALLALGSLTESQINALNEFYIQVSSLNRGLDQINEARYQPATGGIVNELHHSNRSKALNISEKRHAAINAVNNLKNLSWIV